MIMPEEPLPFKPNEHLVDVQRSFRNIPRYLFRLYGPTTAGTTNLSEASRIRRNKEERQTSSRKIEMKPAACFFGTSSKVERHHFGKSIE